MVRQLLKVRVIRCLRVIRFHQRFRKVPLLLMGQHLH